MRILLHGGYAGNWDNAGSDIQLFQKLIDAAKTADQKVLISFLSREKLSMFDFIPQIQDEFRRIDSNVKLTIAGRDNFRELLPQHQIVFLQGGTSLAHQEFLTAFSADEISRGKVLLGGSSSGAMMITKGGFSGSSGHVITGKGIIDLAVLPHANSWPINDYLSEMHSNFKSTVLLLNENEMVELNTAN